MTGAEFHDTVTAHVKARMATDVPALPENPGARMNARYAIDVMRFCAGCSTIWLGYDDDRDAGSRRMYFCPSCVRAGRCPQPVRSPLVGDCVEADGWHGRYVITAHGPDDAQVTIRRLGWPDGPTMAISTHSLTAIP